jgi:uncharacterized membrane protein YkvI
MVVKKKPLQIIAEIAATLIGTVVGAGFASGQEILQFFSKYQTAGYAGIALTILLLGLAVNQVFKIGLKLDTSSYREFLVYLLGPRLLNGADLILSLFLLLLTGVMYAGCGAVFQELQLIPRVGMILTGIVVIWVLSRGLAGVVKVNLVLIPLMFMVCLIVALPAGVSYCPTPFPPTVGWILPALQFSAYNLFLAAPVLLALAKHYPDQALLKAGSWVGSIALGILAALIHWALLAHFPVLQKSALPMAVLARSLSKLVFGGYSLILWGEMLTTLLANTYGLGQRLAVWSGWPLQRWVMILTIAGMFISQWGFVKLIKIFYPIYGWLSLVLLVLMLLKNWKAQVVWVSLRTHRNFFGN